MPVVGPELSVYHNEFSRVIFRNINQTLRDHEWDPVFGIAEPLHIHLYHIETFSKYFMAE